MPEVERLGNWEVGNLRTKETKKLGSFTKQKIRRLEIKKISNVKNCKEVEIKK